jgi:L,D-peptidoglycan transpeptidase YkuD (ErfK/YbiS/YcfS/YnhG family)
MLPGMIAHCAQVIHVRAAAPATTYAVVTLTSCGTQVAGPWRARVGRNGLSSHHREGDGTTPLGTYRIGPIVYGLDRDPGVRFRYHRLTCGDWWDEDSRSPTYNEFHNTARSPGRGSAMFLHVDTGHATNGCVSLPRAELVRLVRWLRPGATITITA